MSGFRRVVATVLCSVLSALILVAIYSELVGLPMPTSAWIFTALCPIVVATPTTFYLVRQGERIRRLHADLHVAYEQLSRLASTDDLTGIANRRAFLESTGRARRPGDWLLLADIDHFKSINDRFGHERGDAFLCAVADILRDAAGPHDCVGRLGGEEFAMLLRRSTHGEAVRTAEAIHERIGAIALLSEDGRNISTTLSIGLTACRIEADLQEDIKRADRALYRAKKHGRNQIQLHPEMPGAETDEAPRIVLTS